MKTLALALVLAAIGAAPALAAVTVPHGYTAQKERVNSAAIGTASVTNTGTTNTNPDR